VGKSTGHVEAAEENQPITLSEGDGKARTEDSTPEADTASTVSAGSDDPLQSENEDENADSGSDEDDHNNGGHRAKVLSAVELEDLFFAFAPDLSGEVSASSQMMIVHVIT
jgi:hypothetical protein